jgi:hypothetical protein
MRPDPTNNQQPRGISGMVIESSSIPATCDVCHARAGDRRNGPFSSSEPIAVFGVSAPGCVAWGFLCDACLARDGAATSAALRNRARELEDLAAHLGRTASFVGTVTPTAGGAPDDPGF